MKPEKMLCIFFWGALDPIRVGRTPHPPPGVVPSCQGEELDCQLILESSKPRDHTSPPPHLVPTGEQASQIRREQKDREPNIGIPWSRQNI